MLNFTPLLGAQSSSPASQSLLELDGGIRILVDVGWDETFDASKLQELAKHVSTLSIVLLTHPTIEHIGAYAHCCKHLPGFSRVPCYATTPVVNLGRTLTTDLYASSPLASSTLPLEGLPSSPVTATSGEKPDILLAPPTADEIATFFSAINPLKYSQPHQPIPSPFSPPLAGLTVTAYSAGHTLGGTLWHIQHGLESIVYAADWNLGRERFFPGAAWLVGGNEVNEPLHRPTALICSGKGVQRTETLPRKKRDDAIISLVRETVAQGGKVLLPIDSSARVLELAFILNTTWRENIDGPHADLYKNTRIYMASRSSGTTIRYLQSMLEWMDDEVIRDAEAAMTKGKNQGDVRNPLDWTFVRPIERRSQVERALRRNRACVMLASDTSLEWGFASTALQMLAADPRNLVILPEQVAHVNGSKKGLGRQLWEFYQSKEEQVSGSGGAKVVDADGATVDVHQVMIQPLNAEENGVYQQYLLRQRQLHSTLQGDNTMNDGTTVEIADDQASESSESSDEDEDAEHQGRALNMSAQLTQNRRKVGALTDAELGVNVLLRSRNVHDYDVRNKRGRERMFPFVAHRNRSDDFGDVIKAEDYLRAEERDDIDGVDLKLDSAPAVGQKRKWDDAQAASRAKAANKGQSKRAKVVEKREPDEIDDKIAQILAGNAAGNSEEQAVGGDAVANGAGDESSDTDESDYEPEESSSSEPQKVIFSTRSLQLRLRIAHVDFSGLYRLQDLQALLPRISPRKLILTAGDEGETEMLAGVCRSLEGEAAVPEVFTPRVGEQVDASMDTNAWMLKLSRELVKRLNWQILPKQGLSLVPVSGRVGAGLFPNQATDGDDESAKKKLRLTEDGEPSSADQQPALPILDLLSSGSAASQQKASHSVHVGDLRLAAIREAVQRSGHDAVFQGQGTLLVDGTVVVRKTPGGVEVEAGTAGLAMPLRRTADRDGTFFAVRKAVYDGLALVAGA